MARRRRKKPEMVGDKPKFRFVKAKKRRGIRALGRRKAIGGMERQILNPATGKYVAYLGPKQEMRLYSPDALAKIEKKEGARKIKAAEIKKKAATPKAAPKKTPKVEKKKAEPTPPKIKTRADTTPKPKPKAPAKAKVAARPRSREDIKIDIPEVINIPGVGEIKLPSKPPAAPKAEAKAKPKKEVKTPKKGAKAKAKSRPTPKPRPVKLPDALQEDILREDIRIKPGMLEGLTAKPVVKAKEKPKPKKEVKTPKKGKVREREDIRVNVPTREDIDKIIKDLDIKIPEVINIPGAGQVTIPAAPKPLVDTPKEKPIVAPPMTGGPVRTPGDTAKDIIFDPGPPRPRGESLKSDDPFFSSPEFEVIKGKPGTRDMYTASDGTEFGSGSTGRAYERYLNRIKEEGSAPTPPSGVGREPTPDLPPAPPVPVRVDTTPQPTPPPEPMPPMPPPLVTVDAFRGFKDSYRPANIVGQSFDPSVRDDYEKQIQAAQAAMMQPGGNIRATEYPTYQTPTMAVPQTQFGGYGQPMPIAPLLPYAGLASATMPEQITQQRPPASGANPNPGTGQIEPVGIAPDPRLLNLPPGVSGPIR